MVLAISDYKGRYYKALCMNLYMCVVLDTVVSQIPTRHNKGQGVWYTFKKVKTCLIVISVGNRLGVNGVLWQIKLLRKKS